MPSSVSSETNLCASKTRVIDASTAFRVAEGTLPADVSYAAHVQVTRVEPELFVPPTPTVLQQLKSGRLKALAVTQSQRISVAPNVPTMQESGLPGYDAAVWMGLLAPAGTPKEVVRVLSDAFKAVLAQPELKTRMTAQGADPAFLGAEDFARYLNQELPRWAAVVKKSGAQLD